MSGKGAKLTQAMPSPREKAVKQTLLTDEQLLAGYSMWEQGPSLHPGRTAQGKDCLGKRWECSGLFLPCQRNQDQGASPGVNPRELLVPLSAFSAAGSHCRGVQWMGDKPGDTKMVSVKMGWLCSTSDPWEEYLNLFWNSCIPRAEEQSDWFHCERCRAGSWSILHPFIWKRQWGQRDHLLFHSPGEGCTKHTSTLSARIYERKLMQQKMCELFCPCLWGRLTGM